jgi:hypothetical protein
MIRTAISMLVAQAHGDRDEALRLAKEWVDKHVGGDLPFICGLAVEFRMPFDLIDAKTETLEAGLERLDPRENPTAFAEALNRIRARLSAGVAAVVDEEIERYRAAHDQP